MTSLPMEWRRSVVSTSLDHVVWEKSPNWNNHCNSIREENKIEQFVSFTSLSSEHISSLLLLQIIYFQWELYAAGGIYASFLYFSFPFHPSLIHQFPTFSTGIARFRTLHKACPLLLFINKYSWRNQLELSRELLIVLWAKGGS